MLPVAKKVALAIGLADGQYNLLQASREREKKVDRLDNIEILIRSFRTTAVWLIRYMYTIHVIMQDN